MFKGRSLNARKIIMKENILQDIFFIWWKFKWPCFGTIKEKFIKKNIFFSFLFSIFWNFLILDYFFYERNTRKYLLSCPDLKIYHMDWNETNDQENGIPFMGYLSIFTTKKKCQKNGKLILSKLFITLCDNDVLFWCQASELFKKKFYLLLPSGILRNWNIWGCILVFLKTYNKSIFSSHSNLASTLFTFIYKKNCWWKLDFFCTDSQC